MELHKTIREGGAVTRASGGYMWKIMRTNPAYSAIGIIMDQRIRGSPRYSIIPAVYAHMILREASYVTRLSRQEHPSTYELAHAEPNFSENQKILLQNPGLMATNIQKFWIRKDDSDDRLVPLNTRRLSGFPTAIVMNHVLFFTFSVLSEESGRLKASRVMFLPWNQVRTKIDDRSDAAAMKDDRRKAARMFDKEVWRSGGGTTTVNTPDGQRMAPLPMTAAETQTTGSAEEDEDSSEPGFAAT